jgi:hypothetical protein
MRRNERGHRVSARILEVAILIALPVLFHYLVPIIILG